MIRQFSASVIQEDTLFVAQCLQVDVASQGTSKAEALANLREALELYFDPPIATEMPTVETIEVDIGAA